ncbi:T9SS type A sorting domain-containing protein, partial [bacterium]|nr:T9SS type A sorting domain-containing protein [bacterium]
DGGFIVAGGSWSNDGDVSGNHGEYDYWVVKLSPEGKITENAIMPEQFEIKVFPNPFNSSCNIFVEARNLASPPEIAIYDLRGNVVYKSSPLSSNSFLPEEKGESFPLLGERETQRVRGRFTWVPDENIPSGIYLVRATIPQQNKSVICTKRIVYLK